MAFTNNILRSSHNYATHSAFKYQGISQYLLEKASENVRNGRTKWMVCENHI